MIKCLIWDLDETLWHGTLADDEEVSLRPGIREVLEQLDGRGILQSVASRNDHGLAMEKLEQLGVCRYFLYPQIGWGAKAEGIRRIASELNIGLDAIAFIDDNPFERYEAGTYLPELTVYSAHEALELVGYPEFRVGKPTREAGKRREMMLSRLERTTAEQRFTGTREDFLRSCFMELEVRTAREEDLDRAFELAARTNQFNNFAERMSEDVVCSYLESPTKGLYVAELKDRFGDHGIVGAAMLDYEEERLDIRLFCISCRIEGRGIGTAFLGTVLKLARQEYPAMLEAVCSYRSTGRNRPALMLLQLLGFARKEKQEHDSIYALPLPFAYCAPDWIVVKTEHFKQLEGRTLG
ncbi:HAD-IIIC family phosphatase [Paenibacillus oleatilyticus]|uniref:HAD-IIIC family phosphatase n=1 Tax=Paenibacillus oleatilyticus TaxID=2594886 RepID=UPI001C1FA606|nr:HAD-IIIC family phosphatase [Paenibacillus oleatilyticus]MBU7314796.1 HAD-IIIC family phosphatase [Paenibacillus oleatilyticus]